MKYIYNIYFLLNLFLLTSCDNQLNKEKVFTELNPKSLGVNFENNLTYTEDFNVYLYRGFYNGAGTGLADFNNDGFLDLFLCGNMVDNALYLGDGKFHFRDITHKAGVASPNAWSTGVSIVDINQDGWLDIYVCKSGNPKDKNRRNELFINTGLNDEGIPVFKESAKEHGIDDLGFSIHAIFFDYDKDGDIDMYLSNNSINPTGMIIDAKKGMRLEQDTEGGDKLYRNDSNVFTNVSKEAGIYSSAIGFGLGISAADVNRDGWPDIYVANDFFEKDYLYINNKDGTFTESIDLVTRELSLGSMGVDIADMNHDGYPEIFVTEMLPSDEKRMKTKTVFDDWDKYSVRIRNGYYRQFSRNTFQMNNRKGYKNNEISFSELSRYSGVAATDWSWGVQMMDFDNDGNNEIFVTNGIVKDLLDQDYINFYYSPKKISKTLKEKGAVIKELIDNMPSQPIPNSLFKHSDKMKYDDVSASWGLGKPSFSSGAAYGDIDNDGDLDIVVSNINAAPFIYKNNSENNKNHFITLSLKNKKNTTAIGTQVTLKLNGISHYQELYPMRGVMSTVDDRLHFGIGKKTLIDTLEIVWNDGTKLVEYNISPDIFLTYKQTESNVKREHSPDKKPPLLTDVTDKMMIKHRHKENNFVDFDKEKLLYHMISNEGPEIAVGDVNGDGLDDFFIGGAKESSGTLYLQSDSGFLPANEDVLHRDKFSEDTGVLFFDADNDGDLDLLISSGGYEFSNNSFALADRLYFNSGNGVFEKSPQILPNKKPSSTSVVINADFDGDGDQDLFFGGRLIPLAYGIPASSFLLENNGKGQFSDVTQQKAQGLSDIGMVTDALWLDFDKDNDKDLIIVGDWMSVKIFRNDDGKFKEVTNQVGLKYTTGFWNTIDKIDLDNDGYEDLIVGNIGDNTFFKGTKDKPIRMYVNDFDNNGSIEQVITSYNGDGSYPIALKKEITSQMPYLLKKYLKYSDYEEQSIDDIFADGELDRALVYEVFQNKSIVLWNDQGYFFNPKELPFKAQLAPIYAIYSKDIDNDNNIELIAGGNQHNAKPQTGIYGSSYGTVLKYIGNREFKVLDFETSGFHINGQIRDIKEITIKGKKHLLVAINNDVIRIYKFTNDK